MAPVGQIAYLAFLKIRWRACGEACGNIVDGLGAGLRVIVTARHLECRIWVKLRRTQPEHISSALPPLATLEPTWRIGSFVPKAAVSKRNKTCAYSITSSARASTDVGMSSPSAFAALRLITSSYLVCACTGSFPQ
jgi:hypothetical protein